MGRKIMSTLEGRLARQGLQAKMELLGHLGKKANQGKMAHKVTPVLRVQWDPWGCQGQWEDQALQANKVHQACQDKYACKSSGVQRVNLGTWVPWGPQAPRVRKVTTVNLGEGAREALQVWMGYLAWMPHAQWALTPDINARLWLRERENKNSQGLWAVD